MWHHHPAPSWTPRIGTDRQRSVRCEFCVTCGYRRQNAWPGRPRSRRNRTMRARNAILRRPRLKGQHTQTHTPMPQHIHIYSHVIEVVFFSRGIGWGKRGGSCNRGYPWPWSAIIISIQLGTGNRGKTANKKHVATSLTSTASASHFFLRQAGNRSKSSSSSRSSSSYPPKLPQ